LYSAVKMRLGSGDDLGVGAAGTSLVGADPGEFGLAPLGLIALCG